MEVMNADAFPADLPSYPKKYETSAVFKDGLTIAFRPIRPTDEALLKELFYSHSERTILHRYFAHISHLSQAQVRKFVTLDDRNDFALIGLVPHEGRERMICVGRYFRIRKGTFDEFLKVSVEGVWPFFEKIGARVTGMWKVEYTGVPGEASKESPDYDEVYLSTRYASLEH